jgi:hypothetical protein
LHPRIKIKRLLKRLKKMDRFFSNSLQINQEIDWFGMTIGEREREK